ncbi:hypothetical protein EV421DRAFT_2029382 [Armillaria borealis]|uniref:Uncharacterized protein n=1 Tax=Armillaria borealis TaxID=47425 RepID=A0AA39K9Z6_9AGAR|nr:hypothetical protein EV421DRAFT_2029382 [Armillaria borealis]
MLARTILMSHGSTIFGSTRNRLFVPPCLPVNNSQFPVPNPTTPFWSIPALPIQKEGSSAALPACVDVVIIGPGITSTAFVRTLLDVDGSLEVVVLELDLKKKHDADGRKEEGLTEESQCRKVDTYDVYFDKDVFEGAKEKLGCYLEELPSEKGGWGTMDGPAGIQLADGVCEFISTTGGATIKVAQDVLFILAIHAHTLSLHPRQHRPHTPRRYSRQTYRPRYQWMDVPPPRADARKDRSRTWTYVRTACRNSGWLGTRFQSCMPTPFRSSTRGPFPRSNNPPQSTLFPQTCPTPLK